MDSENDEMIYVPYVRIDYRERTKTYIDIDSNREIELGTYYYSSTDSFWGFAEAIFYIVLSIMIVILIAKTWVSVYKPSLDSD